MKQPIRQMKQDFYYLIKCINKSYLSLSLYLCAFPRSCLSSIQKNHGKTWPNFVFSKSEAVLACSCEIYDLFIHFIKE